MLRKTERLETTLEITQARLEAVSPLATLARGYAIVRHPDGRIVRQLTEVGPGDPLTVLISDGEIGVTVNKEYLE
jgi:exodeoxyribonuclease VII large subunit